MFDFDEVLKEVGDFGRFQKWVVVLLCFPACFVNAFNGFSLVYLAYTPPHECAAPSTEALSAMNATRAVASQCHMEWFAGNVSLGVRRCDAWHYDKTYFTSTLITRWDLVCGKAINSKNMMSVLSVVTIVGCVFFSYVQDKFGRKPAFIISLLSFVVGSSASLFMPSLELFTAVRVLAALNAISSWNISYVWALEYVGPSKRTLVSSLMCGVYAVATMSLALVGWFCRTWLSFGLATSLPFLLLLSYQLLVPESPRWLLSTGRADEAMRVVQRMARWQGVRLSRQHYDDVLAKMSVCYVDGATELRADAPADAKPRPASVLDLFRGMELRKKCLLITFCWIANAVVYVTIAFNTENLGENFYLTWALQAAVEAPANLLNLYVVEKYGRVLPLFLGMTLSGLFCLLTAAGELYAAWLVVGFAVAGKFFISMSYAIIYQLGSELYPTVVRGVGIGFSSVVGDVGNVLMPYIVHSAVAYKMLPMIIIGILSIVGGAATLFLPETLGRNLPETLDEAETSGTVSCASLKGHFSKESVN